MKDHSLRVLRAWLVPARHLESLAGWLQLLVSVAVLFLPAGIVGLVRALGTSSSRLGFWAALLVLLLTLLALALLALWRQLPNPKLWFQFDRQTTGTTHPVHQPPAVGQTKYFHVRVYGNTEVRNIEGRLIGLERKRADGQFEFVPEFKPPVNLVWDSVPGRYWEVIEPDLPARLNLAFTQSWEPGVTRLAVESHEPRGNVTALAPGTYRLTVRVAGADASSVDGRFVVSAAAEWDQLEVSADSEA